MKLRFPEDILELGEHNLVQFGKNKFLEYFSITDVNKRHVNSSAFALSFVIDGTKIVHTPAGKVEGKRGDCLLIGKGHSIMSERIPGDAIPYQNVLFFISDEFINTFYQKHKHLFPEPAPASRLPYIAKTKVDSIISNFLLSIQIIINNSKLQAEHILNLKLEELLLYILNLDTSANFRLLLTNTFEHITDNFKNTILNNFDVEFTSEDYAHLCAMSLSTFKRKFKEHFGTTPGNWILQRKMEVAEQLLGGTEKTINEISLEAGYENTSHFIRSFKKIHGATPAQFRSGLNH